MAKKYNIAIVGASGNVGREILEILNESEFPYAKVYALASERSFGKRISFGKDTITVDSLENFDFSKADISFFSAGSKVSEKYCKIAEEAGSFVIDNTSFFRMQDDIALVVPQVNAEILKKMNRKIIANPNCSTIQMLVAINDLHKEYKIKRIVVSTYQATSGAGKDAMDELYKQTKAIYEASSVPPSIFKKQIAFNCIPQIDAFLKNGNTKEEEKMINETKKILDKNIEVSATCVRVPVFNCHAESVNIEFEKEFTIEDIKMILSDTEDVLVVDNPDNFDFSTQVEVTKTDEVFVSRIRRDESVKNGINIWVVADNLRKGAALNAVNIAEKLAEFDLL